MSRFQALPGKQVLLSLQRLGFETVRIKGSHHFLRHSDGRKTVVPVHAGETIGPGLLSSTTPAVRFQFLIKDRSDLGSLPQGPGPTFSPALPELSWSLPRRTRHRSHSLNPGLCASNDPGPYAMRTCAPA